jgi:anti-sigma B factor antagonist
MSLFCLTDDVPGIDGVGDVAILAASGEIDGGVSPRLRERLFAHIEAGRRAVVLDLSTVTFLDSTAIGVLVGAVARLQEMGGGSLLVVCAEANTRVLRILDIAGVASLITLYYSREEALASASAITWPLERPRWVEQAAVSRGARELGSPGRTSGRDAARKYATEAAAGLQRRPTGGVRGSPAREVDELA